MFNNAYSCGAVCSVASGSHIDGVVEFVDMASTVLNLADVEIPAKPGIWPAIRNMPSR